MERIICDTYVKGKKHIWAADKGDWSSQEFNRKILAVNEMYGWLYQEGILKDVAFEFKDYSDVTFFALDVKDLEPYRERMVAAGVKDGDVAMRHIFDEYYTQCEYSGAIELGWTMAGYRDVDGCVGRSWECGLLKGLNAGAAYDVASVQRGKGVRAAVSAAFEFVKFLPSDLTRDGERMTVKPLSEAERGAVERLDEMSGFGVSQWLEQNEDYAWGVFIDETLVGYCSIGYADDCGSLIESYPGYCADSLLLSEVFVAPEYQGQGCGAYLVDTAVRSRTENEKVLVFLTVTRPELSEFYGKIGFSSVAGGVMVRDERDLNKVKLEEDFERAFSCFSSVDPAMLEQREYLFRHAEKLIVCYECGEVLKLKDVEFWVQFEKLLGEEIWVDEYQVLNAAFDGDPRDIEKDDAEKISFLRDALENYRENGWPFDGQVSVGSLIEEAALKVEEAEQSQGEKGFESEYGELFF